MSTPTQFAQHRVLLWLERWRGTDEMYELPPTPKDKVVAYLPVWREYRERYSRSGGYDAHIKQSWETISDHMDMLIEAMMAGIVVVDAIQIEYAEAITEELKVIES